MAPLRQWGRNSSSSVDGSRDEALARRLLLHELEKNVGRFAWGADHFKRYAHKLHGWLRTVYGDDERVAPMLVALEGYGAKVGRVQVEEAGHELIARMREDLEGRRFPWHDVPEEHRNAW